MNKVDSSSRDSGLLSNPPSFLHSGNFYWGSARLDDHGNWGSYWSLRSHDTTGPDGLSFNNTNLNPQKYNDRGFGFAVRCVANPSPLSLILAIL